MTTQSDEDQAIFVNYGARRFIIKVLVIALGLLASNLLLSASLIGKPTASSQTLCSQVVERADMIAQRGGARVLLAGGSAVRAGLSAERISRAFNVNAFNFGLQASFGPEIILHEAKRLLRPGDTAILLFEYALFFQDEWNAIALDYAMGCVPEIIYQQSLQKFLEALMAVDLIHYWDALTFSPTVFKATSLPGNPYGDRLPQSFPPLSASQKQRLWYYQPAIVGIDPEAQGPAAIRAFVEYAKANGIQVMASWPNTIDFPEYQNHPGFTDIKAFYETMGVPVIGKPSLALLPRENFYDTQYHLNYAAIAGRTDNFIAALRDHGAKF